MKRRKKNRIIIYTEGSIILQNSYLVEDFLSVLTYKVQYSQDLRYKHRLNS